MSPLLSTKLTPVVLPVPKVLQVEVEIPRKSSSTYRSSVPNHELVSRLTEMMTKVCE
jgi:hypothetical protein